MCNVICYPSISYCKIEICSKRQPWGLCNLEWLVLELYINNEGFISFQKRPSNDITGCGDLCVCVCACREESWNDSTANTWKCCEILQIVADRIRTVYMRMEWMGLETKTKTKQMVINFCCLVLAETFLLVMCVDIGFAFLFYINDCKCCVEFLLSMLFCGTSNIRRLRMPTKWVSTFILEYWNNIVEAEVGLVVPWRFPIFGSLSEKNVSNVCQRFRAHRYL